MGNKRVVVFGGSGFLGSYVADALTEKGYSVVIYDNKESAYQQENQTMVIGNILDEKEIDKVVKDSDYVYNFAGIADIDEASQKPLDSVKVNILGNSIILESCRKYKIKRYIFASSLYVYSTAGSFYRSTKQACELIIRNYSEVYNLPYTILRYGSLFGPRATPGNTIYKFIVQALKEKKITRFGNGNEEREYIHIIDAARESVEILSLDCVNQILNISGNRQMKVHDLLLMISEIFGNELEIEYKKPKEDYHYKITPCSFAPMIGKRLVSKEYLALDQAILSYIYHLHNEKNHGSDIINIHLP